MEMTISGLFPTVRPWKRRFPTVAKSGNSSSGRFQKEKLDKEEN